MVYRGHVKNGVAVLDEPTVLPEGAEVRIELATPTDSIAELREGLLKFAGRIKDMPPDMARRHDYYNLGTPDE